MDVLLLQSLVHLTVSFFHFIGDKLVGEVSRLVVAEACIQALDMEFTQGKIYEINSVEVVIPIKFEECILNYYMLLFINSLHRLSNKLVSLCLKKWGPISFL